MEKGLEFFPEGLQKVVLVPRMEVASKSRLVRLPQVTRAPVVS